MMSSLTDRIFQTAIEALFKRDSELCNHVVAEDENVDILEKQVDQDGVNLLIRFHPVASDMREVISAMKVSRNLERVAGPICYDRAKSEAAEYPTCGARSSITGAHRTVSIAIYRDSMRAYADGDCKAPRTLKLKDRELDALTRDFSDKLVERVQISLSPNWCLAIWTLSSLLAPFKRSGIMLRISLRIPSGAIKPPIYVYTYSPKKED